MDKWIAWKIKKWLGNYQSAKNAIRTVETTSKSFLLLLLAIIFSILSPVAIGTVDLVTIILNLLMYLPISLDAWNTYFKLAECFFLFVGVPTQIKMISEFFTAIFKLFVT